MKNYTITYREVNQIAELSPEFQQLIFAAKEATKYAYAPYSNFYVGAALLLESGEILKGSNQENGAYPSGLCAERTVLFHYGSSGKTSKIVAKAIAATRNTLDFLECPPCGGCRQVMQEYEMIQKKPIKLLFYSSNGRILQFDSVSDLLPFAFKL